MSGQPVSIPDAQQEFVCPGATYAISRSVHLARLAAYYPECRNCSHRHDTGHLPVAELLEAAHTRLNTQRGLAIDDGVRGVYLNELDRGVAARLAGAFASLLWESSHSSSPVVVVGCDQRPSSPELISAVLDSLKRMGCSVVDVGPTIPPHFCSAIRRHQAVGGVFVNGSGRNPSWNGLDFVGPHATPISDQVGGEPQSGIPFGVRDIVRVSELPINRPTRHAGSVRPDRDWSQYEDSLRPFFHALRPLRVVVGVSVALQRRLLQRVFEELPCRLVVTDLPTRQRDATDPLDPDVRRIGTLVVEQRADLGFVIDDDARRCAAVDETGNLLAPAQLIGLLWDLVLAENSAATLLLGEGVSAQHVRVAGPCTVVSAPDTVTDIATRLSEYNADFAGGPSGRYWYRDPAPVCDGVITLGKLMAALSRGDTELSRLVAG